jgi:hypothetical protein
LGDWLRDGKTVFTQPGDMEFHSFADEGFDFFDGVANYPRPGRSGT